MTNYISKVAKKLGIASSKLRYWDKKGLIRFERDADSNYRTISFQSMMDICDILFYRGFGMPIEKIRLAAQADFEELQDLLLENRSSLEMQIKHMQQSIIKIDERIDTIKQLQELKKKGFSFVEWRCPAISRFDFSNPFHVQTYLDCPQKTLAYTPCTGLPDITYGVFSDKGDILQKASKEEKTYIQGLFWVRPQTGDSNLHEFIDAAVSYNQSLGNIIAQYLLTTGGEMKTDYYIGRAEVIAHE